MRIILSAALLVACAASAYADEAYDSDDQDAYYQQSEQECLVEAQAIGQVNGGAWTERASEPGFRQIRVYIVIGEITSSYRCLVDEDGGGIGQLERY